LQNFLSTKFRKTFFKKLSRNSFFCFKNFSSKFISEIFVSKCFSKTFS
jgi:hypothetical protein